MLNTTHTSESGISKAMYWIPRLLCILAILFISLFSLDAFDYGTTTAQKLFAFFMHLIPSFLLTALLVYAWYHEKWGGIIFLLLGILLSPVVFNKNYQMNNSVWLSLSVIAMITFPFMVVGTLFLIHDSIKKKSAHQ